MQRRWQTSTQSSFIHGQEKINRRNRHELRTWWSNSERSPIQSQHMNRSSNILAVKKANEIFAIKLGKIKRWYTFRVFWQGLRRDCTHTLLVEVWTVTILANNWQKSTKIKIFFKTLKFCTLYSVKFKSYT